MSLSWRSEGREERRRIREETLGRVTAAGMPGRRERDGEGGEVEGVDDRMDRWTGGVRRLGGGGDE